MTNPPSDRPEDDTVSSEARARALVQEFQQALDQQFEAVEMRAWPYAPKHIREAYGDPTQPEPPSREAMEAWAGWLDQRMLKWSWRCLDNLEKGERAVRLDPSRADLYWIRATKAAERALAELADSVDLNDTDSVDQEELSDDLIASFVTLLEEYRGRLVVSDSVLPASASQLRAALQQRYQSRPDPALAEALIALPVFVPPEDAAAAELYLKRRTGESGPIGQPVWDRGLAVVERIAGQQRVTMRRTLGAAPGVAGVASPIPVLDGLTTSRAAAASQASDHPEEYTVLKDSGLGCAFLLLGWIPPLVAALVGGVAVALRTGSPGDFAQVLIGGTLAGYVASMMTLFTVGHYLEQRGVGSRVANAFVVFVLVMGVAAAIAVAVSVGGGRPGI